MDTETMIREFGIGWAICVATPQEPGEDEEQEKYLKEWRKNHK